MSGKLHHIGHIVKNLSEAIQLYENKFGLTPKDRRIRQLTEFGARTIFFSFAGTDIELIEPGGLGGDPAARCLKEHGEGLFHLSFRVDDYDLEVKKWRDKGFTVEEYIHSDLGYNVRLAFGVPEETKGIWIEFIDSASIPPRE